MVSKSVDVPAGTRVLVIQMPSDFTDVEATAALEAADVARSALLRGEPAVLVLPDQFTVTLWSDVEKVEVRG